MTTRKDREYIELRKFLNPAIKGPNTNAILSAMATGVAHLSYNSEAVNDSLYIMRAEGKYLEELLADRDLNKPEQVGLSDEVYRKIGIEVTTRKQIRELVLSILEIVYGEEFTRATSLSNEFEPYNLNDGDVLQIEFDDGEVADVVFSASQFENIHNASAQEVSDAITRQLRSLGRRGAAFAKDDGIGGYVVLLSDTIGPSSSIVVVGGKAQNALKFDKIRPTSGDSSTQWSLTQQNGGAMRLTWVGGANPSVGKVRVGDYVNIYGYNFTINNQGTFTIKAMKGGLINEAYVEFENPNGTPEIVTQATLDGVLFFNPYRRTLASKGTFAAAYQTEARTLEVFLPAMTRVVRRDRKGAAHLHESGPSGNDYGPYVYELSKPFLIGEQECNSNQKIDVNSNLIINVDDSSDFPDNNGNVVIGFGTSKEEGPIPYIARPSNNTLMINPSYKFKNTHELGANISLISQNHVYDVDPNGSDYAFYLTDVVSGRLYAEELIRLVAAEGIKLVITILYPSDIGLGKWDTDYSEKFYIFGSDPT